MNFSARYGAKAPDAFAVYDEVAVTFPQAIRRVEPPSERLFERLVSMMRMFGGLAAVAILTPCALAQPETRTVSESDWGPPTNGVQTHVALADTTKDTCPPILFCPLRPALPTEIPHLIVHFRNRGAEPGSFSSGSALFSQIEVDGRWYGWRGAASASAPRFTVPPDSEPVAVYVVFWGDFFAEGTHEKLSLTPGRHSIRLRSRSVAPRSRGERSTSAEERLTVVSNLAYVEIPDVGGAEEERVLLTQASAGGTAGLAAARRMAQAFPASAMRAIEAGARATSDPSERALYVDLAASIPGDEPLAFLSSQLAPEAGLAAQIRAAEALKARNRPEWEQPLLDAWRGIQDRVVRAGERDYGTLISFLARHGSAAAIDALARNSAAPVDTRLAIVQAFISAGVGKSASALDGRTANLVMEVHGELSGPRDGAAGIAMERLLAAALDDTEQRLGYRRSFGGITVQDPRVCDAAAFVLALWWPDRFTFDWAADVEQRDMQIETMRRGVARR